MRGSDVRNAGSEEEARAGERRTVREAGHRIAEGAAGRTAGTGLEEEVAVGSIRLVEEEAVGREAEDTGRAEEDIGLAEAGGTVRSPGPAVLRLLACETRGINEKIRTAVGRLAVSLIRHVLRFVWCCLVVCPAEASNR